MKKTMILSAGLCFASFMTIGILGSPDDGTDTVAIGGQRVIDIDTSYVTLNDHNMVSELTAGVHLDDGTVVECESYSSGDVPWEDVIETTTLTYRNVPLDTGREDLDVEVKVSFPDDAQLVGKEGELRVNGKVVYPYLPTGGTLFEEKEGRFSHTQRLVFGEKGSNSGAQLEWYMVPLLLIFVGSGLVFVVRLLMRVLFGR